MKVSILSSYASGGAGIAAKRLHESLIQRGVSSTFVSSEEIPKGDNTIHVGVKGRLFFRARDKFGSDWTLRFDRKRSFRRLFSKRKEGFHPFSPNYTDYKVTEISEVRDAELVNLHWISRFVDVRDLKKLSSRPVVWTLHDMGSFTGGCHHSLDCFGYKNDCDHCPQLEGIDREQFAHDQLKEKLGVIGQFESLTIVSPSKWLLGRSRESRLFRKFRHEHIPNPIYSASNSFFVEREVARRALGLPLEAKILLFVAYSGKSLKGWNELFECHQKLVSSQDKLLIVSVGKESYPEGVLALGEVNDGRLMRLVYAAADALVLPSRAENLPNTIAEAATMGTPSIAYSVGGIPEMIDDGANGILCFEKGPESLLTGLNRFFSNGVSMSPQEIATMAFRQYSYESVSARYHDLFTDLLGS